MGYTLSRTVVHINSLSINNPEKALSLVDSAERRGLMTEFDIYRSRAMVYHNGLSDNKKSLEYALKAYHCPEARSDCKRFLHLLEMIADLYYTNGDYQQSIKYCTEGITIARDSMMNVSVANFDLSIGRNLMVLNRITEAFRYYRESVDLLGMETNVGDDWETTDDYLYSQAVLAGALRDQERFDEALSLIPQYDATVDKLSAMKSAPEGLADMRKANGDALAAQLYAAKGEDAKARERYQSFCKTEYSKMPDSGLLIIPYLIQSGDYRGALDQLQQQKTYWQANTDTISYGYVDYILRSQLMAYEALGDIRQSNAIFHEIQTLTDSLRFRDRNEKALELAELYRTNEQAMKIERQSSSIRIRNIVIGAGVLVLVVAAIFMSRIIRYNRTVSAKNRAMSKTIDDLIGYKSLVLTLQEENVRLKSQPDTMTPHASPNGSAEKRPAYADDNMAAAAGVNPQPSSGDEALFQRMNFEILSNRLYLNPDFSRTTVIEKFHIPANKFSALFKKYVGCSFTQYVHNCRLDYAVKLMHDNPNWSLDAIAKAAQMSNSTFYSQFQKKYGMRPSDFKLARKENADDLAVQDD